MRIMIILMIMLQEQLTEMTKTDNIVSSESLNKLFPKIEKIFSDETKDGEVKYDIPIPNFENKITALDRGIPCLELEFFAGGKNDKLIQLGNDENQLSFLEYLLSDYCKELLKRNKIKIHIESVNLFFDDVDSLSTVFFIAQQDYTKKLKPIEFEISSDYEVYINEYIPAMKKVNNDKYDISTHRNSKFLFHNFNNYLNRIAEPT